MILKFLPEHSRSAGTGPTKCLPASSPILISVLVMSHTCPSHTPWPARSVRQTTQRSFRTASFQSSLNLVGSRYRHQYVDPRLWSARTMRLSGGDIARQFGVAPYAVFNAVYRLWPQLGGQHQTHPRAAWSDRFRHDSEPRLVTQEFHQANTGHFLSLCPDKRQSATCLAFQPLHGL
jgi:hypothetical protein